MFQHLCLESILGNCIGVGRGAPLVKVLLDPVFLCDYVLDHVLSLALDALHDVDEAIHLLLTWILDSVQSIGLMTLGFSPL